MGKSDERIATAYFLERYGPGGSCYEDSRVADRINDGADHTSLLELLYTIHDDWHHNKDGMFHHNILIIY